ncbi:hypothetical protein RN001_013631 [Aquatica leii]|uniref:Uncharacterized protein n=1 Tax=Aquatica leii TaxID=1421715 RepID=A0AAN7P2R8_9COLE|nr:hypothetical protein RN001_013631 [Aquatica leii]
MYNPENSASARPQELEDTGSSSSKKELVAASIDGDAENFSYNSKILATSEETEVGPEFDKEMKIDDVEDKDLISENLQIIKCPIPKIIEKHDIGFLMFSEETGKAIITDPLRIEIIKHGFKHFQNIEGLFLPTNNRSMNKTWFFKKLGNGHGEQVMRSCKKMYKSNGFNNLQNYSDQIDSRILRRIPQVPVPNTFNQQYPNAFTDNQNTTALQFKSVQNNFGAIKTGYTNQSFPVFNNETVQENKLNYNSVPSSSTAELHNPFENKPSNKDSIINKTVANKGNGNFRLFTGTAEKIIKWHKIYKEYSCYYEIIGAVIAIEEGSIRLQKVMLIRDKKGPILQIVHYVNDHINIENFFVGQMLRCIGRMVGPNMMHGMSIREAKPDEISALQRMCYICDHAISNISKKNSDLLQK